MGGWIVSIQLDSDSIQFHWICIVIHLIIFKMIILLKFFKINYLCVNAL